MFKIECVRVCMGPQNMEARGLLELKLWIVVSNLVLETIFSKRSLHAYPLSQVSSLLPCNLESTYIFHVRTHLDSRTPSYVFASALFVDYLWASGHCNNPIDPQLFSIGNISPFVRFGSERAWVAK